ncbi:hypothetical protein F4821DRAFT_122942 [Hypoxylon rubiginosum]|uniref:Uncharacterized protein n=1 Tax=Hypoxylon rubiginosum TaxID=110542 RepID=A0ACC0D2B7_9PEZI|nr:hypothetical protein F4821DRAFT_122942 [Hypoxylon rubiginosum]
MPHSLFFFFFSYGFLSTRLFLLFFYLDKARTKRGTSIGAESVGKMGLTRLSVSGYLNKRKKNILDDVSFGM